MTAKGTLADRLPSGKVKLRWKVDEEGSKRVVGQCKGMDRVELERDMERARVSWVLEKAGQS